MRERIKQVRQHQGLDQTEFAALIGVSVRTVQNWEAGMAPRAKTLRRLAELADKPVSWFYEDGAVAA